MGILLIGANRIRGYGILDLGGGIFVGGAPEYPYLGPPPYPQGVYGGSAFAMRRARARRARSSAHGGFIPLRGER